MIPSIVTRQVQRGIRDYVKTTFPAYDPAFAAAFDALTSERGLFHDPWVSVALPFRQGASRAGFEAVELKFPPYAHQCRAFDRLCGEGPRPTLVATGTGSGKTECFLYPILEYCWRHRGEKGIKALLIYPMNALATDQARRIASLVWNNEKLRGNVTAGLFVGGVSKHPAPAMSDAGIITDREAMLANPPDILLTNYKMLDYLLVRPKDAALWRHNSGETLRFIVVDELHTFDGAQGTDLACLLRRLKARLNTPRGSLCCVGTSATMGGADSAERVRVYAEKIFGEEFDAESVITEDRLSADEFFAGVEMDAAYVPSREDAFAVGELAKLSEGADERAYLSAAARLWLGMEVFPERVVSDAFRAELGEKLRRCAFLRDLLLCLGGGFKKVTRLLEELTRPYPSLADVNGAAALDAMLALVSHARTVAGRPFLTVRCHLWLRELRRLLGRVSAEDRSFALAGELNEEQKRHYLPVVNCRDCGLTGWAARLEHDQLYIDDLGKFYSAYFSRDSQSRDMAKIRYVFPCGDDEYMDEPTRFGLCPNCLRLAGRNEKQCPHCGEKLLAVRVMEPVSSTGNRASRGMLLCPGCGSPTGMSLVGVRSSTELGALISLLFASRFNDDKKLLAFSDSVQDAAYRAGFFNARTWNFTMRGALQRFFMEQDEGKSLKELHDDFPAYWRARLGDELFAETFIPPALTWMRGWEYLCEHGKMRHDKNGLLMLEWIAKRMKYEAALAWGMSSRRGRTLEKSGVSVLCLGLDRLRDEGVIGRICHRLNNEAGELRGFDETMTEQLIATWLYHMRLNGAFCLDEEFAGYVRGGCVDYLLRPDPKRNSSYLWMPPARIGVNVPRFVTIERTNLPNTDDLGATSWYGRYLKKMIDAHRLSAGLALASDDMFSQAGRIVIEELCRDGLVCEWTDAKLNKLYGLSPDRLTVSKIVLRGRCGGEEGLGGESIFFAPGDRDGFENALCPRIGCGGRLRVEVVQPDYYGRLYSKGDLCRIAAKEHTGLLARDDRENVETSFKRPGGHRCGDANVLSCTPTLEMGIDIGDLSTVMLCSVPPAQSQFAQRTGRAGRTDGNALTITVANSREHDLYYYAAPEEMLSGAVETPHVFMEASAVLERQFTAYCFDCWVKEKLQGRADMKSLVPARLGACLKNVRTGDKDDMPEQKAVEVFPGNFLNYVKINGERLLNTFRGLFLFPEKMSDATFALLRKFVLGDGTPAEKPIELRIIETFTEQKLHLAVLKKRIKSLRERKKELTKRPKDPEWQKELNALEREREAWCRVERSMTGKDIFGFFSDESMMPNYAFPEEGMTLKAILYRRAEEEEAETLRSEGTRRLPRSTIYEYQRPAASAISEFAPENEFFAGGRKLAIDQVDLNASKIEEWRFCPECSHMELETSDTPKSSCPRCGASGWADSGQKRSLLRARLVYSTMEYESSLINDDAEERRSHFYNKQLLVDLDERDITNAYTWEDADFPFGFEFARKAVIRDVNFGDTDIVGEKLRVNGREDVRRGFKVCRGCGKVIPNEAYQRGKTAHALDCKYAGSDENAFADCLFLYREFSTEVLRVLIPATLNARSEETRESFVAAVMLGLKEEYGNVDHLRAALCEVPEPGSSNRRQYLAIYDSVPGGTGYLKGLSESPENMTRVLQKSLNALEKCQCRFDETKDGCYHCLYAFRVGRTIGNLSRRRAIELLRGILKGKPRKVGGLSKVSIGRLEESELETNFIAALEKLGRLRRRLVNGKSGYVLDVQGSSEDVICEWEVEPQVMLDAGDGVSAPCCPDFVLWPKILRNGEKKTPLKGLRKPIAVFADGFAYHRSRVSDDTLKRMALVRTNKFRVWSVNWEDVQAVFGGNKNLESLWPLDMKRLNSALAVFTKGLGAEQNEWLSESERCSPMLLLLAYLGGGRGVENTEELFQAHARASIVACKGLSSSEVKTWREEAEGICEACNASLPEAQIACDYKAHEHLKALLSVSSDGSDYDTSALLLIDDTAEGGVAERSWKLFWRMANLCQFAPHFCMVAKRGLDEGLYAQLPREEEFKTVETNARWNEIFDYLLPDELELARRMAQSGLPAPDDAGVEIAFADGGIAAATLVWRGARVAWFFAPDEEATRLFAEDGWKTFTGTAFPSEKDLERSEQ